MPEFYKTERTFSKLFVYLNDDITLLINKYKDDKGFTISIEYDFFWRDNVSKSEIEKITEIEFLTEAGNAIASIQNLITKIRK